MGVGSGQVHGGRLERRICCQPILIAGSPGSCWSAIHFPSLSKSHCHYLKAMEVRSTAPVISGLLYGDTDKLGMFPLFLKMSDHVLVSCLVVVFRRLLRMGSFPACSLMSPNSKRSILLLSGQILTNFYVTYNVQGVRVSGVGSSWAVFGIER